MYKAKRIDCAIVEAAIRTALADYRERDAITETVEQFVTNSWPKRPDRRVKDALFAALSKLRVSNPVKYVSYDKSVYHDGIDYVLKLTRSSSYTDTMTYTVRVKEEGGAPDMKYLRMSHGLYRKHADLLEAKLPLLAEKVAEFNSHLQALQQLSKFAGDGGSPEYSLPILSDAFGWYEFNSI